MAESQTLARPYADAAFQYAVEANDVAGWSELLARLATIVVTPEARAFISNPQASAESVARTLGDIAGKITEPQRNFLQLLARNDRLGVLPDVREQFDSQRARHQGSLEVVIETAFELTDAQVKDIVDTLSARYGKTIEATTRVEPALIGGVAIRIGDEVIDASVRGKLAQLAASLNS